MSIKEEEIITAPERVTLDVSYDRFLDCVHCGLCLNACPTYVETGNEADSPRGRIHLMRALADGRIGWDAGVQHHLDLCLGCLACETACPSGVQYHEIIEAGRELGRQRHGTNLKQRTMEMTLYDPDRLEKAITPLRLAGRLGLEGVVRSVAQRLPAGLREMVELLPPLPPAAVRKSIPELVPAMGEVRARVGLLTGCVMSVFFSPTHLSTLRVLANNGCEVHIPKEQECCGALAVHSGNRDAGREMARRLIEVFEPLNLDAILVNSAGCGSAIKEYGHLLESDPQYSNRARRFASRVQDVSEFLAALPISFPESPTSPRKVTYHDACHLAHGQKVRAAPRALLTKMPGVELVELPEADWCCGSAGTYNITQPEMAARLQRRKINNVLATGADFVVTGNPGCSLQISRGLRVQGSNVQVLHTMDLLAAAYPGPVPGLREPGMTNAASRVRPSTVTRASAARRKGGRADE